MTAKPLSAGLGARLSFMMFLQYAIWGAWLPLLWPFLNGHRGFTGSAIGDMFAVGAVGAIFAPFVAGQIADRYFSTERFLGISHVLGAVLVWQLAVIESYWAFLIFSLLYSIIYAPTLSLTNSLAFHHLPDRDRDFGKVRVWGTVGWICVGIAIGQWLLRYHTISDQAAAQQVVETRLADADERDRLQREHFVVRANGTMVSGQLIDQDAEQVVLRTTATNEEDEVVQQDVTFDLDQLTTPPQFLLASLAPADDETGMAQSDAMAALENAIMQIEADDSPDSVASIAEDLLAAGALSESALGDPKRPGQRAGMADAFRLSALLGLFMGLYCFTLPHTPPSKGQQSNASLEAIGEVKRQPLLTLFLLAVPISCIHQFYFVHTAGFLNSFQLKTATQINALFGVGGGGLMTIGQMSEIIVLAMIPVVAKTLSRKNLLMIGIIAYTLRMLLFAYVDSIASATGIPAVALLITGVAMHGFCFGCFIFVAFMIVDEETTPDVRASAQSLFNLVIVGVGIIVGSKIAGWVAEWAMVDDAIDFTKLFSVPMWGSLGCLVFLLLFYPGGKRKSIGGERDVVEPGGGASGDA